MRRKSFTIPQGVTPRPETLDVGAQADKAKKKKPTVGDRRKEWTFLRVSQEHDLKGLSDATVGRLLGSVINVLLNMRDSKVMHSLSPNLHTVTPKGQGTPCGVEYQRYLDPSGCACVNVWTMYCPPNGGQPYLELTETICDR